MKALISDVHGNYEALKAVFEDIDSHGIEEVFFLGDVVGYGPEPEACIDLVEKRCNVRLLGNHDWAMLNAPLGFNPIARGAIECLKGRMEPGMYSMPWKRRRWKFLGDLRQRYMEEGLLFVHASPRDPVMEYVLPTDATHNPEKVESIFERVEHVAFCGHTHMPGVMTLEPKWLASGELENRYKFTGEKAVVNIGSVGQPRDHDPRACYLILGDGEIEWRKVAYNINSTVEKIGESKCLHPRNGERLLEGR